MSNHQYTSDILADALFRASEPTDSTGDFYAEALTYLNMVYYQICRGGSELLPDVYEDWAWLRKPSPGTLILKPALNSGTIAATLNSASATLSATVSIDLDNYYLRVAGHPDVFKIQAHTAGSASLTLDSVYTGPTVTAANYKIFALEYNLAADVMRIVAPMRVFRLGGGDQGQYKIFRSDVDTMEEQYPVALVSSGTPDLYAEVGETTSGTRRVRFNRFIDPSQTSYVRVEYEYLFQPTPLTAPGTSEEPVLPKHWRHVLADFTLAYLFGTKDDSRAGAAAQVAQAGLAGMARENRYQMTTATKNLFRLFPRSSARFGGVLRTDSGIRIR